MLTLFDKFMEVIAGLEKENVDYILIGGFAVILYGLPRFTQDVDLFLRNDSDNIITPAIKYINAFCMSSAGGGGPL